MIPRHASIYILETEHSTSNKSIFYGGLREDVLSQLALMLEEKNNSVKSFLSLRNLIQINAISNDVALRTETRRFGRKITIFFAAEVLFSTSVPKNK